MRIAAAAVLFLVATTMVTSPASAQEVPPRSVSVSATDTVRVSPDRVILRFAVITRAQQPEAARQQNEQAARSALASVRGLGIPERQIQVQTLRLTEEWEHRQGRRVRVGFIARRDVEVIIDQMDRLPAVVAAVIQEGATELGGIMYGLRDRRTHEDEALRRAALRARQKADVLAGALGTSVRAVHAIAEAGVSAPRPMFVGARAMEMDMALEAGEPEAYAAGEIEIRATLTVVFEID